jgi:maltose alpha-D-glucosyltransferase/alpha-amylase
MNENPLWYKDAVFYEVNVRAYRDSNADGHGDLAGLASKLDYLQDLGVDCLWLLPIYGSPLVDDGYDIADYYQVQADYGTVQDFKDLIEAAHQRGIRVIADLVLNHTSDQHPWFQAARADKDSPYRDYYVWSDSDQVYQGTRIIFVDHQPSNWAWDEVAGQYFWHRFYAEQPDLNFDNPEVRQEMKRVAKFWLDMGIDGFRADAVPYLIEREGTSNENLPETHEYLRELRAYIDQHYPGRILLCEANMWPEDVRPYFGEPEVPGGAEFQMGFHFPIMPRIYMALRKGDITDMVQILDRTPSIPEDCQWCSFLRNHDELTLEMVTESDRQWMWQEYAPEPRMRLNLGIRRRLAPLLDNDPRKISVANSILFTLIGSPIIYYGDEIGLGDNIWLEDRNGVRTPMQWDSSPSAGFSEADPQDFYLPLIDSVPYDPANLNVLSQRADQDSLFHTIKKMVAAHKAHKAFGWGSFKWVDAGTTGVAAYLREYQGERILVLNNVSNQLQPIRLPFPLPANARDLLNDTIPGLPGSDELKLLPYQYFWIMLSAIRL